MTDLSRFRPADPLGLQRVIRRADEAGPALLPPQAERLDPALPLAQDELLIEVESLHVDSTSFRRVAEACGGNAGKIEGSIRELVKRRGKYHDPTTDSGGMLVGRVAEVGPRFPISEKPVKAGDRIVTLVSSSLTPLEIRAINEVHLKTGRVALEAHAILFASGPFAHLPGDLPEEAACGALGVAGASVQTARFVQPKHTVVVLGGGGKAGSLCLYEAKKKKDVHTIAVETSPAAIERLRRSTFVDEVIPIDARDAIAVMEKIWNVTKGRLADVVIDAANVPGTEMSCILSCKPKGVVYFFNLATNFPQARLGAEGVGADLDLRMGRAYAEGHAEAALDLLRESEELREQIREICRD